MVRASDYSVFQKLKNFFLLFVAFVAEVTIPSLGVGFELGFAYSLKKPILCLYRPQHGQSTQLGAKLVQKRKTCFLGLSAMIQGAEDGKNFVVKHYEEAEADEIFRNFFQNIK